MTDSNERWIAIVSGLPRSGTSMMMRMLEAGGLEVLTDSLREPDADNPAGYYEFEPVKRLDRDTSWLEDVGGKAVKMVYMLLYKLPKNCRYKVIFMRRNLDEVIASQDMMLRRHGKTNDDVDRSQLKGLFESQLGDFEHWVQGQENIEILSVNYNRMIHDPRSCIDEVNRLFDGKLDAEAMARVYDPSLYRQRR
jgi:hypothetical protein